MLTHWTSWLVAIQIAAVIVMVLGVMCQKYSWLEFPSGFLIFGLALLILFVLGVAALIIVLISFVGGHQEWRMNSLLAAVIGIAPVAVILLSLGKDKLTAPAIHDITTEYSGNLVFVTALQQRKPSDNDLAFDAQVLQSQKAAYPNIQPQFFNENADSVYKKALSLVKQRQWNVIREEAQKLEIEAVVETSLFGFKDDVLIRISQEEGKSRVDMRSASRVGRSDLGANSERIANFLKDLNDQ